MYNEHQPSSQPAIVQEKISLSQHKDDAERIESKKVKNKHKFLLPFVETKINIIIIICFHSDAIHRVLFVVLCVALCYGKVMLCKLSSPVAATATAKELLGVAVEKLKII